MRDLPVAQIEDLRLQHQYAVQKGIISGMIRKGWMIRDWNSDEVRLLTDEEIALITTS